MKEKKKNAISFPINLSQTALSNLQAEESKLLGYQDTKQSSNPI